MRNLFFPAPEIQTTSQCTLLSDLFSLGMVICAVFNSGKSLIEANHSNTTYMKQFEVVRQGWMIHLFHGFCPTGPESNKDVLIAKLVSYHS